MRKGVKREMHSHCKIDISRGCGGESAPAFVTNVKKISINTGEPNLCPWLLLEVQGLVQEPSTGASTAIGSNDNNSQGSSPPRSSYRLSVKCCQNANEQAYLEEQNEAFISPLPAGFVW